MSQVIKDNLETILGELRLALRRIDNGESECFRELLLEVPGVFVVGAGRSGLMVRAFAMRLRHLGLPVSVVGDILARPIQPGDLLVVASGSGETGSLVAIARKARELGASLALLTANPASTLADLSDCTVVFDAPTPKAPIAPGVESAQPMGSLFEQALFLFLESTIMDLMRQTGQDSSIMSQRHANLE